jgi:hypothetical protein
LVVKVINTLVERKIPLFWFAVLLLLWIASYTSLYITATKEVNKIEAFMSAGGRFTKEMGIALEARVQALEDKNYIEVYTIPEKLSEKVPHNEEN